MKSIWTMGAATVLGTASLGLGGIALAQDADEEVELVEQVDTTEQADAAAEAPADAAQAITVVEKRPQKITDRTHPDYVRCKSERVIGSLAKRKKKCMTNREWRVVSAEGNKRANEFVDEMRSTSVSGNN